MSRSFNVRATLRAARRYLVVPLIWAGIGLVAAQPVTHRMPATYEASASMVIIASTVDATTNAKVFDGALAQNLLPTVAQLAQSREVALSTAASLGLPSSAVTGHVKGSYQRGTQIVVIRAAAPSAAGAAAIANAATQATVRQFTLQIGIGGNVAAQVLDRASPPAAPVSPNPRLNDALGAFLGLSVGLGLGWLRGRVDDRLRRPAKLGGELGLPVLGAFGRLPDRYARHNARTLYTRGSVADAAAGTVAALTVLTSPLPSRRLLVTSVRDDDGKALVSALLALAMSESQDRVTLIEGQPRRPGIGGHFPEAAECTLATALAGNGTVAPLPGSATLSVIAAGPREKRTDPAPGNGPKIGSREIGELINAAADGGGIAIVHAPPVLAGADLAALTRYADGLLLIVRTGVTRRAEARRAAMLIRRLDLPVAGIVAVDAAGHAQPERYQDLSLPVPRPAAPDVATAPAPAPAPATAPAPAPAPATAPAPPPAPAPAPAPPPAVTAPPFIEPPVPAGRPVPASPHASMSGGLAAAPPAVTAVGAPSAARHRRQETPDALCAPLAALTESLELAALADEDTVQRGGAPNASGDQGPHPTGPGSHPNTGLDQRWQLSTGRSAPESRHAKTNQPKEFA